MATGRNKMSQGPTRRDIERAFLAREALELYRMNLAVMLLLSVVILSLIVYLLSTSVALHQLAGMFWTTVAEYTAPAADLPPVTYILDKLPSVPSPFA